MANRGGGSGAGGVVHVADMPNNPCAPINDATYRDKQALVESHHLPVHYTLYAGIGPGTRLLSFPVPYKAYMGHSVGDLFFTSLAQIEETLQHYRCAVSFHCEDPELMEQHKGAALHEDRRPAVWVVSATRSALRMIEKYDLTGKLCHYSVGEGLPLIREIRVYGPGHLRADAAPFVYDRPTSPRPTGVDADESAARRSYRSGGDAARRCGTGRWTTSPPITLRILAKKTSGGSPGSRISIRMVCLSPG
ncbi:MAG: hypothetical protein U0903_17870 [Planctomycetales bacterium]